MRLPRLTTRRLMVLVAAVAISIVIGREVVRLRSVSQVHRQLARNHAQFAATYRLIAARFVTRPEKGLRHHAARQIRLAEYHERLSQRLQHAARYPWIPVSPNPPQPE